MDFCLSTGCYGVELTAPHNSVFLYRLGRRRPGAAAQTTWKMCFGVGQVNCFLADVVLWADLFLC